MGLEPTENPNIQETLEEMGEIENEEIEEKQLYKDTVDFEKTGGEKLKLLLSMIPLMKKFLQLFLMTALKST